MKDMQAKATMKDIAQQANASISTVSRVLSRSEYPVNAQTRERILSAAQALGYHYTTQPQQLDWEEPVLSKGNRIIGVIVPNLTNPHYTILLQGIEDLATRNDYNILLCNANRDADKERDFIKLLQRMKVKGMILSPTDENLDVLQEYHNRGGNVVSLSHRLPFDSDCASFNYLQTGFLAADYLYGLGHRRLALFTSPPTSSIRKALQKGFVSCLRGHGLPEQNILLFAPHQEQEVADDSYEYLTGISLVKTMLKEKTLPTAIFCGNDMIAVGAMHQLHQENIAVPRDISILGFDNIPISRMTLPALSTIDQSSFSLGAIACDILLKRITNEASSRFSFSLEPTLLERDSTRKL